MTERRKMRWKRQHQCRNQTLVIVRMKTSKEKLDALPTTQSQQYIGDSLTISKRKSLDLTEMIHNRKRLHTMKRMNSFQHRQRET